MAVVMVDNCHGCLNPCPKKPTVRRCPTSACADVWREDARVPMYGLPHTKVSSGRPPPPPTHTLRHWTERIGFWFVAGR